MASITDDECRRFKLWRILETAGQRVLTYTLQCGTPGKMPTDTLLQYLNNLPKKSMANYTRVKDKSKCFNKTEKDQINRDPTCKTFDVSLSYKAIKLACENVADANEMVNNVNVWTSPMPLPGRELEHYTTKIKESRNEVVHEDQPPDEAAFLKKVTTLLFFFDTCLRVTKVRYAGDDAEYRAKWAAVQATVTAIRQEILGVAEMLQRSAARILPNFKLEADQELTSVLDSARYLTPLHFLSGIPEHRVEVGDIFCDITLTEERGTAPRGNAHKVPYLGVLRLCEGTAVSTSAGAGAGPSARAGPSGQARPQVLVVEGEAGSGKTTWTCFLVQQWLTPQDRRRVQGLERYQLLLRVVCRERSSPTLEGLVQQLLPESHLKYSRLLLPLLKKCRVLVVIDGIDEMNDVSRPLVANILSEAAATAFTVVCTTRPHSVEDLKTEARLMHFQVSHVRMLGVSGDAHRMELVVRHYQWLCAGANTAADTDALRQAVRAIVWSEVFRLPLNLLFLATMFFYEPHRVSTSINQNDLYQHIHTWCREKLQARLGAPSQAGQASLWAAPPAKRARRSRQAAVDRTLDVIYEVALKGLLQDRVCLNDQDLKDVEDACSTEHLDPDTVLSAFYSMRTDVTAGVVRETYMAPHKSLQEFMAAKGIARQVMQYSEEAIERVLRGHTAGQDPPLSKLKQTLVHLLSLLTGQGDAMKEAVGLLRRSGVTYINDWLRLLTDAMVPDAVVQHAAEQLVAGGFAEDKDDDDDDDDEKTIEFWDEYVQVASVMLQHLPRQKVEVWLEREVANVENLARCLAHHKVTHLLLQHHFMHPDRHSSATLLRRLPRSGLQEFRGHLDAGDLALLPPGLESLRLAVRDSRHAQNLLSALAETSLHLEDIILHIPVTAAATPAALTRLPAHPDLTLYLSGVTDLLVEAAVDIMAAVCPPEKKFEDLYFPIASLNLRGWEDLFSRMQQAKLTVRNRVRVPDTNITKDEESQLNTLAKNTLGCAMLSRVSNEESWL